MKHAGIERPAKVPASAVQHWEGVGWQLTDPPAKAARPTKTYTAPTTATSGEAAAAATAALANKTTDVADAKTADTTAKKPSTRRKED